MIRLNGVYKQYPDTDKAALRDINLHVPRGARFGLLGPNGAGKTTLISLLLGLRSCDRGEVRIDGLNPFHTQRSISAFTGLAPQELAFYPSLTVAENLRVFGRLSGATSAGIREAISVCSLKDGLKCVASELSGGLQRRLNLALALVHRPRLLLLDEPTVGVDPQSREFILDSLARLSAAGTTLIYTTHYMQEVQRLCDQVAILDHGKVLVEGSLQSVLATGSKRVTVRFFDKPETVPDSGNVSQPSDTLLIFDGEQSLQLLTEWLPRWQSGGDRVEQIRYGSENLEDLFLDLTGRGLREES